MPVLLAPLLAQLATVGVSDRTEARHAAPNGHYEAATRPGVRLQLAWPRYTLGFGYGANLTLTPLESTPRELLVYHTVAVDTAYRWRHTSVFFTSSGSLGKVNFRRQALNPAGATPPVGGDGTANGDGATNGDGTTNGATGNGTTTGGTTAEPGSDPNAPTGTPNMQSVQLQQRATNESVAYGVWSSTLGVDHQVDRAFKLGGTASYVMSGGLESEARVFFPIARGVLLGALATYTVPVSTRDSFVTLVTLQQGWSSLDNNVTVGTGSEAWNQRISRRTFSSLSVGVSMARAHVAEGYEVYSTYPTFSAALGHGARLGHGSLTLGLGVYSAPAVDPLRAAVDPRVGANGNIAYQLHRFFANVNGGFAASIARAGDDNAAFNNLSAGTLTGYKLTDWMQIDAGATMAQQAYRGTTTVPFSYALMAGLTFGVSAPIGGRNR